MHLSVRCVAAVTRMSLARPRLVQRLDTTSRDVWPPDTTCCLAQLRVTWSKSLNTDVSPRGTYGHSPACLPSLPVCLSDLQSHSYLTYAWPCLHIARRRPSVLFADVSFRSALHSIFLDRYFSYAGWWLCYERSVWRNAVSRQSHESVISSQGWLLRAGRRQFLWIYLRHWSCFCSSSAAFLQRGELKPSNAIGRISRTIDRPI